MRKLVFLIVLALAIGCQGNRKTITDPDIEGDLIIDSRDYSVQQVYHLDSLYKETLRTLKKDEGMNEEEAIKFLQYMIDKNLLPIPEVSFFDKNGNRKRKELPYEKFQRYADIIMRHH